MGRTGHCESTFDNKQGDQGRVYQLVQRLGERPEQYEYKSFLSTTDADEVVAFMDDFPDRWHVEEFFHNHQALGWKRAGTLNLHIRYARMTMALIARAALHQLRQRLGEPYQSWEADLPPICSAASTGTFASTTTPSW